MADEPQDKLESASADSSVQTTESKEATADKEAEEKVEDTEQSRSAEEAKEAATEATEAAKEAQPEPATKEPKAAPKPVSANLEKIIEQIEKLSVLELADLVHALEDRFGVSAAAPVAVAAGGAIAAAGEPAEEKTTFNVILSASGANKISVIKAVRELIPTLGLKEAKDLVEAAPKPVLEGVGKDAAGEAKTKLTAAGGTVELQ